MAYNSYFFEKDNKTKKEGDILYLNLYLFNNRRKEPFTEREKEYILKLQGNVINDCPIIGSFCKSKCTLEEVKFYVSHVDFRFNFEKEAIRVKAGTPVKVITCHIVEGRYYFKKGAAAIFFNGEEEEKASVSIIYAIEDYVKLKLSSGLEFTYTVPRYKEFNIERSQLEVITDFLKHKLEVRRANENDQNINIITIDNFTSMVKDDSTLLKIFSPKTKVKNIEFFYKDFRGEKQKVVINENGKIYSTVFLEVHAFEEIVKLFSFVQNCKLAKEFLIPIEQMVDEYCNFIHKDMLEDARRRQQILVCEELEGVVEEIAYLIYGENYCCGVVYLNIVMNVLIKICQREKVLEEDNGMQLINYSYLTEFLKLYMKKKYRIELTQEEIAISFSILRKLINKAAMDDSKLIEYIM